VVAIRFFIKKRKKMIENNNGETLYDGTTIQPVDERDTSARSDLQRLFSLMTTKRYVFVIQRLVIEGQEPEQLAKEMDITVENLYNIKRRAMAQLTQVALNDIREYEK
jgi:DNA-directed RNA polymerase specialized sigma24 family protein